jgi:hypothetical protein
MGLWKELLKKHPNFAPFTQEVKSQLKTLGSTPSYQQLVSSRSSIPRTQRLFDARPECHRFSSVLPGYTAPKFS